MKFSKEHEWAKLDGDVATIGITDYAANQLGDVVFVEMPSVGKTVKLGATIGSIESVKTVSDIYAPISGEVVAINDELDGNPALINESPLEAGWILKVKVSNAAEFESLMNEEDYRKLCE